MIPRAPGSRGAPLANYRVGPSRGPGGAPRASMSFKMSHIEAKSINIWLRYDLKSNLTLSVRSVDSVLKYRNFDIRETFEETFEETAKKIPQ